MLLSQRIFFITIFCLPVPFFSFINNSALAQANKIPYHISSGLFDSSKPDDLGLSAPADKETITIFRPSDSTQKFCLGAVLIPFKGYMYAQWQTSEKDEDTPDSWIAFSRSQDGMNWSSPDPLVKKYFKKRMHTSGGWCTDGETLVAYVNIWQNDTNTRKGGNTEYITSQDGINWSDPQPVRDYYGNPIHGIIEQDMHALPGGRIITAFHEQAGLIVSPYYTDDPKGISGWKRGIMYNLPFKTETSRELEPGWFYRPDGKVVMVFRDQNNTFYQLASESSDRGVTWTTAAETNMPDSRAKQSAGNLPDGSAFLVNCPSGNKDRFPLVITLSRNGEIFDTACVLRKGGEDLQPLRYEGRFKRPGYHYPKSIVWNDYFYVSYTTNKEDVEITRVPLKSLMR
jgi:hypothetical protein